MSSALKSLVPVAALLLAFSACGTQPASSDPAGTPDGTTAQEAAPTAPVDPNAAPTDPPAGERFSFEQAARFEDGLHWEVSAIRRATAAPGQTGAEGTKGETVVAEILLSNQTTQPYDATQVEVLGYYSEVGAQRVVDPAGAVGNSFAGTVPAGGQARATMAWAMPFDELGDVSIVMDDHSEQHGQIRFNGPVN